LVIGLLLGLGAAALAENSDRRLRDPNDLEEFTKLPLLSSVSSRALAAPVDSLGQSEEAFQMLRAALTYFNVDRKITTLVITSPGEKEGKTTVAIRLSMAAARAGRQVIVVDADLRRCGLTQRLGLNVRSGLGGVLVGEQPLSAALVDYRIDSVREGGKLDVLPAGPPPPNPSELLSSREMQRLLSQLEMQADLVVIDTPAALAVSDALPLLPEASGIVLVARIQRTRREAVRRLQSMITATHGTLLGVVATGTARGPGYESYAYRYEPLPNRRDAQRLAGRLRSRLRRTPKVPSEFATEPPKSSET
jgi:capsular exopolysaccharide synthesis family protein